MIYCNCTWQKPHTVFTINTQSIYRHDYDQIIIIFFFIPSLRLHTYMINWV